MLKKNDKVALIAPASAQKYNEVHLIEDAINILTDWDLEVKYKPNTKEPKFYLSACDKLRENEI